jgi:hypothetical protein
MRELFKMLIVGALLLMLNLLVLKVFPSLNIQFYGLDMYVLFLNILFILYVILPQEVGTIFGDLGKKE